MAERETPIDEGVVRATARFLGGFEGAGEVADWAREHPKCLGELLYGFGQLINDFNATASGASVLEIMPNTAALKVILEATPMPSVQAMAKGNFVQALRNLRDGKAVETIPADLPHDSFVVETMAYVIEETLFLWAEKNGLEPTGGWEDGFFLQVLGELLMLRVCSEADSVLAHYFLTSIDEGGSGWITPEMFESFQQKFDLLFGRDQLDVYHDEMLMAS